MNDVEMTALDARIAKYIYPASDDLVPAFLWTLAAVGFLYLVYRLLSGGRKDDK